MPILKKLQKFLEDNNVKYEEIRHKIVYTAHDKASTLKVPERVIGKTLVVKFDKSVVLVLISAHKNLDKQTLKKLAKSKKIDFVKEAWMKRNFKGVKMGSVPPFGNLWKLATFVDGGLIKEKKVILNSGDYKNSIKINPSVLKKVIPGLVLGNFSKKR